METRPLWQRLSLLRSPLDYTKVQAVIGGIIRGRAVFANRKEPGLIIDVGCGPNRQPENINIDYFWSPGIDVCADATKGIPLPDNYARAAFTEHCLEHVPHPAGLAMMKEIARILKPGSRVRVVVPDLEIYFAEYAKARAGEAYSMPYAQNLPGSPWSIPNLRTAAQSVNHIMHGHGHQFIYDFETLAGLMEMAGFTEIERKSFGEGTPELARLDTPSRVLESLYVEAKSL